jgi:hypothetical protein
MSLMRLLSVSRSFCARVPDLGRYQMTGGMRLPRFGSAGKPMKPVVVVATQEELPITGAQATGPDGGMQVVGERRGEVLKERTVWWRRWAAGWSRSFTRLLKPAPSHRPIRRPVQTAFLLESVKVVRNDLADADLELVRRKRRRRAVTGEGTVMRGASTDGRPREGLGRTAVRWLTAGRIN